MRELLSRLMPKSYSGMRGLFSSPTLLENHCSPREVRHIFGHRPRDRPDPRSGSKARQRCGTFQNGLVGAPYTIKPKLVGLQTRNDHVVPVRRDFLATLVLPRPIPHEFPVFRPHQNRSARSPGLSPHTSWSDEPYRFVRCLVVPTLFGIGTKAVCGRMAHLSSR